MHFGGGFLRDVGVSARAYALKFLGFFPIWIVISTGFSLAVILILSASSLRALSSFPASNV